MTGRISPELRTFIDRVVVPALIERFLSEHASTDTSVAVASSASKPMPFANRDVPA